MKKLLGICLVWCLTFLFMAPKHAGDDYLIDDWSVPTGEDVLVVYNTNSSHGQELAQYYQTVRNIPHTHMCGVVTSTKEVILLNEFNGIRQQVEDFLEHNKIKYLVDYIVLIKGVPLKISDAQICVDQALAQLFQDYDYSRKDLIWPHYPASQYPQPTSGTTAFFKSLQSYSVGANERKVSYVVTRLDSYSVEDVKGMIDRAANTQMFGSHSWVIDNHPRQANADLTEAYVLLKDLGQKVYPLEENSDLSIWITEANEPIMGYTSWGIHAGMPDGYMTDTLKFEYEPGALFTTYESFNGFGFISPDQSAHGQVAEFISVGGSGGVGNVYEPYQSAIAKPAKLFGNYLRGHTFGEAAYSSIKYLDWMSVVVGDPLMRIENYPMSEPYGQPPVCNLRIRVFLQGAYLNGAMRTDLINYLPTTSPYSDDPVQVGSIPENVVDWVLVKLKSSTSDLILALVSAFILSTGQIISVDGEELIPVIIGEGDYYLIVEHRNHLDIMSAIPIHVSANSLEYDFTTGVDKYYGNDAVELEPGYQYSSYGMYGGDSNGSNIITQSDKEDIGTFLNQAGYFGVDINMSGIVTNADKDLIINNSNKASNTFQTKEFDEL